MDSIKKEKKYLLLLTITASLWAEYWCLAMVTELECIYMKTETKFGFAVKKDSVYITLHYNLNEWLCLSGGCSKMTH